MAMLVVIDLIYHTQPKLVGLLNSNLHKWGIASVTWVSDASYHGRDRYCNFFEKRKTKAALKEVFGLGDTSLDEYLIVWGWKVEI